MVIVVTILVRALFIFFIYCLDFGLFLIGYGILRVIHISVNWVIWSIGGLIIFLSLAQCFAIAFPDVLPGEVGMIGNPLGTLAVLIAVYAVSQWIMRQWYLFIKTRGTQWLRDSSRTVLIFVRKQHVFFGSIIAVASLAHFVSFLPHMQEISFYEKGTGFLALGLLALIVFLGAWLWIVTTLRKRPAPKLLHNVHASLTIAFFIVLFLHL